jgi:L-alanine-DL-glutamate epimerase-like enolase superfamily enzyme
MPLPTDIRPIACELYYLPFAMRMPLKFGTEVTTSVTCARVKIVARSRNGQEAEGWGETPLSVAWVWPGTLSYEARLQAMKHFCEVLARAWSKFEQTGHAMDVGHSFAERQLPKLLAEFNTSLAIGPMPLLALVCCSAFDIALHDAYGKLADKPVYQTYNSKYMENDLSTMLQPADGADVSFAGKYPGDFLAKTPLTKVPVWHLVGGLDPLETSNLKGTEPKDGYPVLLRDWIKTDGLKCLKIKLRGNDEAWDYQRTVDIGKISIETGVDWLTTDFNCTVTDPAYVNRIIDRLRDEYPRIHGMILYVEQPFPYDLEEHRIDVHSTSARKPLFMDESAHDWKLVRLGRSLGWTGVALKTCKTQTGALLSLCWAKAHGMTLMVQDLSNPMLAQLPHVQLAAHAGTIMGVESNGMQFSPESSKPEEAVHPGLYRRRNGVLDLSTITGSGFGYRLGEIHRQLPAAAVL